MLQPKSAGRSLFDAAAANEHASRKATPCRESFEGTLHPTKLEEDARRRAPSTSTWWRLPLARVMKMSLVAYPSFSPPCTSISCHNSFGSVARKISHNCW
jgi:hypothetical protein